MDKKSNTEKQNRTKLIIIIVFAASVLFCILVTLLQNIDLTHSAGNGGEETRDDVVFETPDYSYDIMQDEEYLALNRYLRFTESGVSTLIVKNEYAAYGDEVVMFNDYFNAIIAGDAELYNSFFTEDYQSDKSIKHKTAFTMQQLYDIEIEKLSFAILNEGTSDQTARFLYRVTYLIRKNNGTFRGDVGSNAAVPEIYEILIPELDGIPRINSIVKYKLK